MEGKLFTCQWFYKADGIGNYHRQAKVSLQTTLQNFLIPSWLATQAVGRNVTSTTIYLWNKALAIWE